MPRFCPEPPDARPFDIFVEAPSPGSVRENRFVHMDNYRMQLIFVDGSCLDNGKSTARAGFGIYFFSKGKIKARLELGPNGEQTSNLAELRGAIAALGLRHWPGGGFQTTVIATDSEYLVLGATEYYEKWRQNGWKTSARQPVKNQDLWEELLAKIEDRERKGGITQFWLIPRAWDEEADSLARAGAVIEPAPEEYAGMMWMPDYSAYT